MALPKDVVLAAVRSNYCSIELASPALQSDPDVIEASTKAREMYVQNFEQMKAGLATKAALAQPNVSWRVSEKPSS